MVSPAKYFDQHAFSDIFRAFRGRFTVLVVSLIIFFSNNNVGKGKSSSKILYEEIEYFLKTNANTIALGIFFSLYSQSSSTKLGLFSS